MSVPQPSHLLPARQMFDTTTSAQTAVSPRWVPRESLSSLIKPGGLVYLPGASGAPLAFVASLLAHAEHQKDLRLLTSYVPGINTLDMQTMDPSACVTGLFMQLGLQAMQRSGQYRCLPLSYAGFVRHVLDRVDPDLAVVQLAPPDAAGCFRR